jgi:hypothetical protein
MASERDRFQNAILCEDVRYEVGNKKSLIGTFAGNIIVSEFPAAIQLAVYLEYTPKTVGKDEKVDLEMWQDDVKIGSATIIVNAKNNDNATLILPRAIVPFKKEGAFRVTASIDGGQSFEVLTKQLIKGAIAQR